MTKAKWYLIQLGGESYNILARWIAAEGAWDPMQLELVKAEQVIEGHLIEVDMPVGAHEAVLEAALSLN
jgi:hypothetical protein